MTEETMMLELTLPCRKSMKPPLSPLFVPHFLLQKIPQNGLHEASAGLSQGIFLFDSFFAIVIPSIFLAGVPKKFMDRVKLYEGCRDGWEKT
ncbi:MAG: hypothetical protein WBG50_25610 [Desulfomonilaceae bacterium]